MRILYLQRNVVERERPAFLQRGAVGAPILYTVRRSAVHLHQHRSGRVGQENSGRGAELQGRQDGQIKEKSNNDNFIKTNEQNNTFSTNGRENRTARNVEMRKQ